MKIVRILGGLGNQMFQYAFYKALQNQNKRVLADVSLFNDYKAHNGFELEDIFDLKVNKASQFTIDLYYTPNRKWYLRKLRRLLNLKNTYQEEANEFAFDKTYLSDLKPYLYFGYWQNEGYFKNIDLSKDFVFKNPLSAKNQQILEQIKECTSISIHVRRGDYLNHPQLGNLCNLDYYSAAIKLMQSKFEQATFFIFSNDIVWCKEHLQIENAIYIDWNNGRDSYIDMQLMSHCYHHIIANSSFSWWAAWLNTNPDKIVIAPRKWVNSQTVPVSQIIPESWTSI